MFVTVWGFFCVHYFAAIWGLTSVQIGGYSVEWVRVVWYT